MSSKIAGPLARVVTVQAEGPEGYRELCVPVGVAPFRERWAWGLTVIVRLDLDLKDADGRVLEVARPRQHSSFSLDQPSKVEGAAEDELDYASDFALRKPNADVSIVGSAKAVNPALSIPASLRLFAAHELLLAVSVAPSAGLPSTAIPLSARHLAGSATSRTAPSLNPARWVAGTISLDDSGERFNHAAPAMRVKSELPSNGVLELANLLVPGTVRVSLPGLAPMVSFDGPLWQGLALPMALDTVWLDVDSGQCSLVWRGILEPFGEIAQIDRLVVSMERTGEEREARQRLSDLQRGKVSFAWTEEDVEEGRPPPVNHLALDHARAMLANGPSAEPRLELATFAALSAALVEWPQQRSSILGRHQLSIDAFEIEERAWMERIARDGLEGEGALGNLYGEHFIKAQDALGSEDDSRFTLEDYAGIRAEFERGIEPPKALAAARMTLPQFFRMQRRFLQRAAADSSFERRLNALIAELARDVAHPQLPTFE